MLEITVVWNPVRPAVGQHFDPALIKPPEDVKLICHGVMVTRILAAESVVGDDRGEIVLTLGLLAEGPHFDSACGSVVAIRFHRRASVRTGRVGYR